jgi:hypothetical protein
MRYKVYPVKEMHFLNKSGIVVHEHLIRASFFHQILIFFFSFHFQFLSFLSFSVPIFFYLILIYDTGVVKEIQSDTPSKKCTFGRSAGLAVHEKSNSCFLTETSAKIITKIEFVSH